MTSRKLDVRTRLRWLTDRAFAMHVDDARHKRLFFAAEMNDDDGFRSACGLSSSNSSLVEESRDVFDRELVKQATATLVGGGDEVITLMHFLCSLSPLRRNMIRLVADANPELLIAMSSVVSSHAFCNYCEK